MKLCHFFLDSPVSPQYGLRAALRSISTEYAEFPWYSAYLGANGDATALRARFLQLTERFRPDVVFMQIQTAGVLPGEVLDRIPGFKVSWCGDLRDSLPQWAIDTAPHVGVTCFSNMRDVETMRELGFNAEFLNIGFSTDVFCPKGDTRGNGKEIVFMGSNYGHFPCSPLRERIVRDLQKRYGSRFAVYGHGWGDGVEFLNEPEEAAAYRACKIALDANHFSTVSRFTSDRRFRAMGSGAFTLANWHPGIEEDFRLGEHLIAWRNEHDIPGLIDYYLRNDDQRQAIATAGCNHVHQSHSWHSRMPDLLAIIDKYTGVAA